MEEPKGRVLEVTRMTEQKCIVGQCCCGCTLRTGSMIIAVLSLVGNIFLLANSSYAAVQGHNNASWVSVVVALLHFIVSVLLIVGIRQEKRNFMMIWVWVTLVRIVISAIMAVIAFIGLVWQVAISLVITVLLYGYCAVVVRSYALSVSGVVGSPA
ncbi:unnamed protein product [Meganyctiphanes norvegica]|uniref:DUF7027 domain-containing protein n=1 Tax=Meganyctiphanes norvegica TaxID=48144 RepID=A0AAV2Q5B7_MEGNR